MNKPLRYIFIIIIGLLLMAVRYFETHLFYDPLLFFFKSNFAQLPLPDIELPRFYSHLTFRFLINTALSLAMLWFLFLKWEIVKIAALIYTVFFVLFMLAMVYVINISEVGNHQLLFYIRRFLIQPLLLLLLIPAFYFVKR